MAQTLVRQGHTPIAYSPVLGDVAQLLRRATVPVIDDLERLSLPPDVIHGQHTLETLSALLRFPGVPAVYFCHSWIGWSSAALPLPRIRRFVAVDDACRDRLLYEHGVPTDRLHLLLNFVDLEKFPSRPPLPARPARALAFGNDIQPWDLEVLAAACARQGLHLDAYGLGLGRETPVPQQLLPHYDLVFAKARCALEAMAVGAAVVLFGANGLGPLVTAGEFDRLRRLNFGIRSQDQPIQVAGVVEQIARYDAEDAQAVSARVRAEADKDRVVHEIVKVYRLAMYDQARAADDPAREGPQAAAYLRQAAPLFYSAHKANKEAQSLRKQVAQLTAERDKSRASATRPASSAIRPRLSEIEPSLSLRGSASCRYSAKAGRYADGCASFDREERPLEVRRKSIRCHPRDRWSHQAPCLGHFPPA